MTLKDISNGPSFTIWIAFAFFAIISIVLLSGHGANFIAGYNTMKEEDKKKYDEKKMCLITGVGMAVIAVSILIMGAFESILPAAVAYVFLGIIIAVCITVIILINTICRK